MMEQGLTLEVEQVLDLLGDGGPDDLTEQSVQTGQQQSADDHGDQNLDAGVHIAFGLDVGNGNRSTGSHGIELFTDIGDKLLHKKYLDFLVFEL